jgi:hypothetical protein
MVKKIIQTETVSTETIKAKRGRKSKKELMASLNMEPLVKDKELKTEQNKQLNINLSVTEIVSNQKIDDVDDNDNNNDNNDDTLNNNIYTNVLDNNDSFENKTTNHTIIISNPTEEPKIAKKRGRKPKGGKIVQQLVSELPKKEERQNVILHLKCSMKDLQTNIQTNNFIESYNFLGGKSDLNYVLINNENSNSSNVNGTTIISIVDNDYDYDCDEDENVCKDSTKEIWKKLKQLEHNLHTNNVNNKRSSCFWDTCEFDNPPIYIPKHFINGSYHVYGCFCSPECGVAYLMNECIDSSTKFERYHLFNHIYSKIYGFKKNIKPAPNPYYMLEKYYGNLTTQEYRSLLRNERLFLIVDKPLTRILPELHEDNDDFILNNKIIPSNNYQLKTRLQRKKQNKNSILNEKFGGVTAPNME